MSDEVSYPGHDFRGSRAGRYGMGPIRPQRRGFNPESRRLLLFFGGVITVVAALAGIATFTGHHHGGIPVISADPRPYREKPADPGGLKIDAGESDVFSGDADNANAKLAPAAEAPDPSAFRSAEQPVARTSTTAGAPIVAPVASPPIPTATATAPVQPAAEPQGKAIVASTQATQPMPATKPPVIQTLAKPAPAKPAVLAAATPAAPKPAPAAPVAQSAGNNAQTGGRSMIQLAAVGSEDAAKEEWQRLLHRFPDLARHQPAFSHIERDGKTYWRVRATGFADAAQAHAFCEQVRGKGGGCSVADF